MAGFGQVAVYRTGPGKQAVDAAVRYLLAGLDRDQRAASLLILAGVAGALDSCPVAPAIVGVRDAAGNAWAAPPLGIRTDASGEAGAPPVVILGLDRPVCTVAEKRRWREETGATIVDTESHGFAGACSEIGCRWVVVRGISDGHESALPPEAAAWVGANGTTRVSRVISDLMIRPRLIGPVIRLGRRSGAAMELVGRRVCGVVSSAGAEPENRR